LDFKQLNEVASFMGFPNRFPHWRFGMEYERLSKSYAYGLHKIYEMVINNDPCYAYLLQCNNYVDQRIVMAHVYGHCDFFKNNFWFQNQPQMMDEMATTTKVRKYIDKYGYNEVEATDMPSML
jgi:stage V sporulation protein R